MEVLKPVEIGFRRFLVWALGMLVKRSRPLPASVDFSSKKFLFVRQDRIGDVLVSTPLIHALKKRYPNATVDLTLELPDRKREFSLKGEVVRLISMSHPTEPENQIYGAGIRFVKPDTTMIAAIERLIADEKAEEDA